VSVAAVSDAPAPNSARIRLVHVARPTGSPIGDRGEKLGSFAGLAAGVHTQPQLDLEFRPAEISQAEPRLRAQTMLPTAAPSDAPSRTKTEALDFFDRQPTSDANLPDPKRWAARLSQAIVEVRAGSRPAHQLLRWTSIDVFESLSADVNGHAGSSADCGRISSVHVTRPADGVAEVSAVVTGRQRARAIALRLEGWDGRWLCTTLAIL